MGEIQRAKGSNAESRIPVWGEDARWPKDPETEQGAETHQRSTQDKQVARPKEG